MGRKEKKLPQNQGICLKNHPEYWPAKKHGDYTSGQQVVDDLVSEDTLERIYESLGDREPLIVAPSLTKNDPSNVIPIWFAYNLGYHLDLNVCSDIFQRDVAHRTGRGGFYRLVNEPELYGTVLPGQDYLIVDDVATMGGTLASLRNHIEQNGGNVIGLSVLADSNPRRYVDKTVPVEDFRLDISQETLEGLRHKHGRCLEGFWEDQKGYGLECLTEREGQFLLFFPNFRNIRRAFLEEKDLGGPRTGFRDAAPEPAA